MDARIHYNGLVLGAPGNMFALPIRSPSPYMSQIEEIMDSDIEETTQELKHTNQSRLEYATKEDWTTHKNTIGELYSKRTLPEVMKFMKDKHGLKATRRMYITRLGNWGFDTKNKKPPKRTRADIQRRRQEKQQMSSTVVSRPTASRNKHNISRTRAGAEAKRPGTPSAALGSTIQAAMVRRSISFGQFPQPSYDTNTFASWSPILNQQPQHMFAETSKAVGQWRRDAPWGNGVNTCMEEEPWLHFQEVVANSDYGGLAHQRNGCSRRCPIVAEGQEASCTVPYAAQTQVTTTFTVPGIHEKILLSITTYFTDRCETGVWKVDENLECWNVTAMENTIDNVRNLGSYCGTSLSLLQSGNTKEAERCLIAAMGPLDCIVRAEDPEFFPRLIEIVANFAQDGRFIMIAASILKQVAEMVHIVHGGLHPLAVVASSMADLDPSDWNQFVHSLYEGVCDSSDQLWGPLCGISARLRYDQRKLVAETCGAEAVIPAARRALKEYEIMIGVAHFRTNQQRINFIDLLLDANHVEEAAELSQVGLEITTAVDFRSNYLWSLGACRAQIGSIEQARHYFEETILLLESEYGRHDSEVIQRLRILESHLSDWGDLEAAAEVRRDLKLRMDVIVELV